VALQDITVKMPAAHDFVFTSKC